jgi:hypothetical protein
MTDALQNIRQIRMRVYVMQFTSAQLSPTKHPIFTHGDRANFTLKVIRVHRHIGIFQKDTQFGFPCFDVLDRFG